MGSALGELTADAYLWAAEQLAGLEPGQSTVAVTADGVLRAPLYAGESSPPLWPLMCCPWE